MIGALCQLTSVFDKNAKWHNARAAPRVPPVGVGAGAALRGGTGGHLGLILGLATQDATQEIRKAAPLLGLREIMNP